MSRTYGLATIIVVIAIVFATCGRDEQDSGSPATQNPPVVEAVRPSLMPLSRPHLQSIARGDPAEVQCQLDRSVPHGPVDVIELRELPVGGSVMLPPVPGHVDNSGLHFKGKGAEGTAMLRVDGLTPISVQWGVDATGTVLCSSTSTDRTPASVTGQIHNPDGLGPVALMGCWKGGRKVEADGWFSYPRTMKECAVFAAHLSDGRYIKGPAVFLDVDGPAEVDLHL